MLHVFIHISLLVITQKIQRKRNYNMEENKNELVFRSKDDIINWIYKKLKTTDNVYDRSMLFSIEYHFRRDGKIIDEIDKIIKSMSSERKGNEKRG